MIKFPGAVNSTRTVGTRNESFDNINHRPKKQPRTYCGSPLLHELSTGLSPLSSSSSSSSSKEVHSRSSSAAAIIGRDMLMSLPTLALKVADTGAIYFDTDIVDNLKSDEEHVRRQPHRRSRRENAQSQEKPSMTKHGSILGRSRDSFLVKLMEGTLIE